MHSVAPARQYISFLNYVSITHECDAYILHWAAIVREYGGGGACTYTHR